MKNLIVVGDSFCSSAMHWPTTVAQNLNLNLICYTQGGGQPWWNARQWLVKLEPSVLDNTDIIIFAHTNAERIPTSNRQIGLVDHSKPPSTEIETAIHLYYKYIFEPEFSYWAHSAWFQEITKTYGHKFLVHLHCFPWTMKHADLLTGINITTNLRSLSLNEIGAESSTRIYDDVRPNHLNIHNNQELGLQLSQIIARGQTGNHALDTTKFDLKTTRWFDWS
jgi:hypothetical protein